MVAADYDRLQVLCCTGILQMPCGNISPDIAYTEPDYC